MAFPQILQLYSFHPILTEVEAEEEATGGPGATAVVAVLVEAVEAKVDAPLD